MFTDDEISRLKQLTIYDIIRSISSIKFDEIQPKLFQLPIGLSILSKCYRFLIILIFLFALETSNPISAPCQTVMRKTSYECVTGNGRKELCLSLGAVTRSRVINDNCTIAHTFDYFEGSEISFALTFFGVGLFGIACVVALKCLADRRKSMDEDLRKKNSRKKRMTLNEEITLTQEWVGKKDGFRNVQIHCKANKKCIVVKSEDGSKDIRSIDFKEVRSVELVASANRAQDYLQIKVGKEYDLVLKFDSYYDRERFASKIELFLEEIGIGRERIEVDLKTIMNTAYTKQKRQKHLEQFFRVVFSHVS